MAKATVTFIAQKEETNLRGSDGNLQQAIGKMNNLAKSEDTALSKKAKKWTQALAKIEAEVHAEWQHYAVAGN